MMRKWATEFRHAKDPGDAQYIKPYLVSNNPEIVLPLKPFNTQNKILLVEGFGFLLLLILTWLDEGVILSHEWLTPLFEQGSWDEAVLDSIAIALVGLTVMVSSYRLLKRLHYVESFLRVCAWCRKLDLDGQWVPMEKYLHEKGNIECSHGICELCATAVRESER